jgi:hypothetical protein
MSTPAESSIPTCPTCSLPMIADASELKPMGITKSIFHCPACRAEAERIAKAETAEPRRSPTPP